MFLNYLPGRGRQGPVLEVPDSISVCDPLIYLPVHFTLRSTFSSNFQNLKRFYSLLLPNNNITQSCSWSSELLTTHLPWGHLWGWGEEPLKGTRENRTGVDPVLSTRGLPTGGCLPEVSNTSPRYMPQAVSRWCSNFTYFLPTEKGTSGLPLLLSYFFFHRWSLYLTPIPNLFKINYKGEDRGGHGGGQTNRGMTWEYSLPKRDSCSKILELRSTERGSRREIFCQVTFLSPFPLRMWNFN